MCFPPISMKALHTQRVMNTHRIVGEEGRVTSVALRSASSSVWPPAGRRCQSLGEQRRRREQFMGFGLLALLLHNNSGSSRHAAPRLGLLAAGNSQGLLETDFRLGGSRDACAAGIRLQRYASDSMSPRSLARRRSAPPPQGVALGNVPACHGLGHRRRSVGRPAAPPSPGRRHALVQQGYAASPDLHGQRQPSEPVPYPTRSGKSCAVASVTRASACAWTSGTSRRHRCRSAAKWCASPSP